MNCCRCQRLLSEHVDGDLPPRLDKAVRAHLASCDACLTVQGELETLAAVTHALGPAEDLHDLHPGAAAAPLFGHHLAGPGAEEATGLASFAGHGEPRAPDDAQAQAIWGRISAALDQDAREARDRRDAAARWGWPRQLGWSALAPTVGVLAVVLSLGGATALRYGARACERDLDATLRAQTTGALVDAEDRYQEVSADAEWLAVDPSAGAGGLGELPTRGLAARLAAHHAHRAPSLPADRRSATIATTARWDEDTDARLDRLLGLADRALFAPPAAASVEPLPVGWTVASAKEAR